MEQMENQKRKVAATVRAGVVACAALITALALAEVKPRTPDYRVNTVGGSLEIFNTISADRSRLKQVTLNGKSILEETGYEGLFGYRATYPKDKPARLVLISIGAGVVACPDWYRVLEIKEDGTHRLSNDFGNCQALADPKQFKTLKENPVYQNGEWRIALPPPGGRDVIEAAAQRGELKWYIYRDGKITPQ